MPADKDPEELVGKNVYDYVSPHNLEEARDTFARLLARPGIHPPFEFDVPHKDGSRRRSEFLVNNLLDDPSVGGVVVNQRDVTERKEAEKARLESERRFRQLFENSSDALFVHDERGRFVDCNAEACRALGYAREELLELSVADVAKHLISEEERQGKEGETLWERAMRGQPGRIVGFEENELRRKDGTTFPVEVGVGAIEYEGRRLIFAAARDTTERKRAEEDLRHSEFTLRALYEAGQILASSLEREEIGLKLLRVTRRISALEAAILDLCDEGGELEEWHSVGAEGVLAAARDQPRARAAAREAAGDGRPRSVELPLPGESGREAGRAAAGVFVPLRVHDRVIGVLEAYGPTVLPEEKGSVETLASLASQGASALENARLYEQLAARERELQELVGRIFVAQEEERRRIAYDIHDGLAQLAAAAYRRLELFSKRHPPDAARDREELEGAVALVRQTVGEARRIIADLRPTALDDFGLATAVRMSVDDLRAEGFEASYEEALGKERLLATLETALFRVAQEALTNVRKHAATERVRVSLGRRDGVVHLEVRDWGRGFEGPSGAGRGGGGGGGPGERVGLSSMQERVALLGGRFEIVSEAGKGTSVRVEIPVHRGTRAGKGDDR